MTTNDMHELPVAVIGAGPIGLAAAAHLAERGVAVKVYEAGARVGANLSDWAHVRVFTTWEQNVDTASRRLLEATGWTLPDPQSLPTGGEIVRHYLEPLARTPLLAPAIETGARVLHIARTGIDKTTSGRRAATPFELRIAPDDGRQRTDRARAVIDASGTWQNPNPAGANGFAAEGEHEFADRIAYGMPDVLGRQRARYAGKRIAVIGSGYSAINTLLDLAELRESAPTTRIRWIVRGSNLNRIYGGGEADGLPARGRLGDRLRPIVESGGIALVTGFRTQAIVADGDALALRGTTENGSAAVPGLDEIVVVTGQRPDISMTRELRLELDPWLESVKVLGPLIDPNVHVCGTVPPHGHRELLHPEPDFYTIGVKSYGRAPTFLLLTGYEQARSVAAAIAGDRVAADNVQLELPETGICLDDDEAASARCGGGPSTMEAEEPVAAAAKSASAGACCGPAATPAKPRAAAVETV